VKCGTEVQLPAHPTQKQLAALPQQILLGSRAHGVPTKMLNALSMLLLTREKASSSTPATSMLSRRTALLSLNSLLPMPLSMLSPSKRQPPEGQMP
jgi:hypothetical protein